MTAYINTLKEKGLQAVTINQHVYSIKLYYSYLKTESPVKGLKVRGMAKRVKSDLLNAEELEEVLQGYMSKQADRGELSRLVHERNIVVLSLVIYQGLHSGELSKLKVSDVDLAQNNLYIPSTGRSNSRVLKLKAMQGLILSKYIEETRAKLLKTKGIDTDLLLDTSGSAQGIVAYLLEELKRLSPLVKNARQLRGSVIVNWLKEYNLREVQYMSGHRYISSTQAYRQHDQQGLKEALSCYHPLR